MIGWLGADGFDWLFFFLLSFLSIYSYTLLRYVLTTKILVGRFEHLDCYFRRCRRRLSSERMTRQNKTGKEGERTKEKKESKRKRKYGNTRVGWTGIWIPVCTCTCTCRVPT